MSERELVKELRGDFSLHRQEDEPYWDSDTYTLTAPQWYVAWSIPTAYATGLLASQEEVLDWHIGRGTHQLVEGILDNPVVKEAVDTQVQRALEDAKENLLKRLYEAEYKGRLDGYLVRKIVEEEFDGNRNT